MATIGHYDQLDVWTPQATFTVNGANTDPTAVTARVLHPDGTTDIIGPVSGATGGAGITRVSAGVYTLTITLDDAGYWFTRFEGTGTAAGAVEHQAIVDPSEFYESAQLGTRALVSLPEAKDWLQYQNIDTTNDLEIARAIRDVSDRLMQEAGREFKPYATNPQARTFQFEPYGQPRPWLVDGVYMGDLNPYRRRLRIGDLATLTTVEVLDLDWTTVTATIPTSSILTLPTVREPWQPITSLEINQTITQPLPGRLIRVTGAFGFPEVPGSIRQACLDSIAWLLDRDVEHYQQDLGVPTGQGGTAPVIMVAGGAQRILSLPPAALAAAWAFREPALH